MEAVSCRGFLLSERCCHRTDLPRGHVRCCAHRPTMMTAEVPSTADIVELPWGPINPRSVDVAFWDDAGLCDAARVSGRTFESGPKPKNSAFPLLKVVLPCCRPAKSAAFDLPYSLNHIPQRRRSKVSAEPRHRIDFPHAMGVLPT